MFHAYTTQKQCTIQMASGVNIKQDNDLLDEYESHWTGDGLARNWVLESGVKGRFGGQRYTQKRIFKRKKKRSSFC